MVCHSLSQDVVAWGIKDLKLPPPEQAPVKPDHPVDVVVVVVVVLVEQVCPAKGAEGGERGTPEVVEQVSPVQGEEGEEQEVSETVRPALILLAETVEGAGRTGDLEEGEEELGQGHIRLMVEHHLTLVSNTCMYMCNSLHTIRYMFNKGRDTKLFLVIENKIHIYVVLYHLCYSREVHFLTMILHCYL